MSNQSDCLFKINHTKHSMDGLLLTDPRTAVYDQQHSASCVVSLL